MNHVICKNRLEAAEFLWTMALILDEFATSIDMSPENFKHAMEDVEWATDLVAQIGEAGLALLAVPVDAPVKINEW
jgi:hypothetical protein